MKKIISVLIVLVTLFVCACAVQATEVASGTCGDNVTWTLTDDGTLTISGTGEMAYYSSSSDIPWYSIRDAIQTVVIESGVTSIGSSAFSGCSNLTSITIPEGVTSVGFCAFKACSKLTTITIPESVNCIERNAFYGCSLLTNITIPKGVTSIGSYAFYGCSSLKSITLPDGVTSIGDYTFNGCSSLASINIPVGVTSIGSYAFSRCTSLTSIRIPTSVETIGECTFSGCSSLSSLFLSKGLTSIGRYAFQDCTSLASIAIPEGVMAINENVFRGCTSLESITLPSSVLSIGSAAFHECSALTSIHIPEGVIVIDVYAFSYCMSLTSITVSEKNTIYYAKDNCLIKKSSKTLIMGCNTSIIPADGSVTSIDRYAFYGCSGLTNILIPASVTSIDLCAFYDCTSLTGIVLPEGVTTIRDGTFYGCKSLTSIFIPKSVTSIDNSAFYGCYSLTKAYYLGTEEDWGKVTVAGNNTCLTNHLIYHPEHVWGDGVVTKAPTSTTEGERTYTCECGATKAEAIDKVGVVKLAFSSDLDPTTVKNGDTVTYTLTPNDVASIAVGKLFFRASDNLEFISGEANGESEDFMAVTFGENVGSDCYLFYRTTNSPLPLLKLSYKYIGSTCGDVSLTCTASDMVAETDEEISMKINDTYDTATLSETVHVFGEWEKFDENQHARSCGCGGTEYEDHEWDSGVVVTEETATAPGVMKYTCSVCGATKTEEFENKLVLKPNQNGIEIMTVEGKDYFFGLGEKKTVADFKAVFSGDKGEVLDKDGNPLAEDAVVGTGCRIRVLDTEGHAISDITLVVTGDVDGNGSISSADALITLRNSAGITPLDGPYFLATDIDGNGKSTSVDALRILRYVAKLTTTLK